MSSLSTGSSSWFLLGAVVAVVIFTVTTASRLSAPAPATDDARQEVFALLAEEEKGMRRDAAKDFPADVWSQDDAFHNSEYRRAKSLAGQRDMPMADVLRAVDEGLHHRWPPPENVSLIATVPPCRPRPIH